MRLRNIRGSREIIANSPFVLHEPEQYKGHFSDKVFHNDHRIEIEIGMGKGRFLMELAQKYPEINFIGIEKYSSVLLRAIQKMEQLTSPLPNLYFIRMDAENITDVFGKEEVSKIYLNFSDPWPKDRHAKRRLPSMEYLRRYDKILQKDGVVEFKTDNTDLFDFALEQTREANWTVQRSTRDLHNDETMNQIRILDKRF